MREVPKKKATSKRKAKQRDEEETPEDAAPQIRPQCGTSAAQVRHKCGTSAAQVCHKLLDKTEFTTTEQNE